MDFLRNNWFRLVFVVFAALAFYGLLFAQELSLLQRLLLASLMALALHQFEEYQLPGGGPVVINRYFYGETSDYLRFPGNWQSVMVVNLSAYMLYVLALALPDVLWLGIATMFFNLYQVLGHCIQMNVKMRTWYNPGMATSLCLFLPLSCWYLSLVVATGQVSALDWGAAVLMFVAIAALTVVLLVQGMKDRNTRHAIPQWQADQLEKVRAACSLDKKAQGNGKGDAR